MEQIIKNERLVANRIEKLEKEGYRIEYNVAMGAGGVGQVRYFPRLGCHRIQVSAGYGQYNYATVVRIEDKV